MNGELCILVNINPMNLKEIAFILIKSYISELSTFKKGQTDRQITSALYYSSKSYDRLRECRTAMLGMKMNR